MDFNIELVQFPSMLHSHIYSKGRSIMPLSRTLDTVSDAALRKSCVALHGFVMDMLSDMYDNPEAYHLPVMKWEEFCDGKPLDVVKREYPKKIKDVYAQTSHAASGYLDLLRRIGNSGTIENDAFVVLEEKLKEIGKRANTSTSPISLSKRLEALSRVGFVTEALPTGGCSVFSKEYPDMFPALCALPGENFSMLDFRNITNAYKPTFEDYFCALFAEQREQAYELHNFAMAYKMRISINANWGVLYHYKSKQVMCIGTGDDVGRYLSVKIIGKDKNDDCIVMEKHLEKESQNFQEKALLHITGCDTNQCMFCSTYSSGKYVNVLGKRHQMCGTEIIGYAWRESIKSDMTMITRLIEIRCEMIDEERAAKKAKI